MRDDHKINLQNRCRYGNCLFKEADYPVPKNVYTKEFLHLGYDITKVLSEVHPSKVCNKHKALLIRVRNSIEQNTEFRPTTNVFAFQEHNQNCLVCATPPKTPGRKKKCLSVAGPGRSNVDIKAVPQDDETAKKNALQIAINAFRALDDVEDFFRTVISELSAEQLSLISSLIGKKITSAVKIAASELKGKYKKINYLRNYNTYQPVLNTNPNLVSYLKGVCEIASQLNKRQVYLLSRVIEGIYKLSYGNIVYPLAFLNNLQTYVETGSRQTIDLNGASTGSGQYDTNSNWLVDLASSPVIPPEGDLGHAFDNNQRIAKTWHIEVDSKVKASVITTHIWLSLDKNGKLQESKNLKPVE